ncbi:MAG: YceI family protein [Bdellovibrionales bacterium]|jgi:hypothetical protein|nr:YceI family protein [Bdellovibrionales bacterium]MBT3526810.1 YceI family protein [Bdellovibrionales bacterium]MBT7668385.1 YceI family protein [Bdellovibrionales bacterium]MBT7767989.1 YceI family protein [Bdellovibrionales bacterium]
MRFVTVFSLLIFSLTIFAADTTRSFSYSSYEAAVKAATHLHFEMESTKAGIITTGFTGVVKKFDTTFVRQGKAIQSGATISFAVKDMDTDVDGRNEKMYTQCFSAKEYPTIKVQLGAPITIGVAEQSYPATINLRGAELPITIRVTIKEVAEGILVSGNSNVTLSALKIPDPSIWIATVRDMVEIKFKLLL